MTNVKMYGLLLALAPIALGAQASGQASGRATGSVTTPKASASTSADVNAQAQFKAPKGWSAEGTARLEAMYAEAREKDVPREPIAHRVAEGSAKGASETTILESASEVKARLEASHEAMVAAGRKPTPKETERGATAMEHGVTKAQIEAMARHTPSDRSLVVAFDVLSRLAARGVPVTKALAQVQGKLDARASDAAIVALVPKAGVGAGASANGSMGVGPVVGAAASGAATAAAGAGAPGKGVAGAVTGAVTGVVKKP